MSLKYCIIYDDYPQYQKKHKCRLMISLFLLIFLCVVLILHFSHLVINEYSKVCQIAVMSSKSEVCNLLCDCITWSEILPASLPAFNKMVFDGR